MMKVCLNIGLAFLKFNHYILNQFIVQICHKANNIKSKRVIEKCGCKYEGTLRDFFYVESENKYVDRLYYSILRSECNYINN